jgi:hypothetical protein
MKHPAEEHLFPDLYAQVPFDAVSMKKGVSSCMRRTLVFSKPRDLSLSSYKDGPRKERKKRSMGIAAKETLPFPTSIGPRSKIRIVPPGFRAWAALAIRCPASFSGQSCSMDLKVTRSQPPRLFIAQRVSADE